MNRRHRLHTRLAMGAMVGAVLTIPHTAGATILIDEDFENPTTIADNKTVNLKNNPGNTSDDNLNSWIDFPNSQRWQLQTGGICASPCSGQFAQHLVQTSDQTNMLFYALDISGFPAGTVFQLDFDYIMSSGRGSVIIGGMLDGQHSLDPNAPWFNNQPGDPDPDDGIQLLKETLNSASWTHKTVSVALPQQFDVLAVGFIMGGVGGSRGVDNVRLQAVAEPASAALLVTGLIGLGGLAGRRKRRDGGRHPIG